MAGDWIKMRLNLDTDPKVMVMAADLQCHELMVVGALWKFWGWVNQHSVDGNGLSVTEALLDRYVGVTGLCAAMRKVGWLEGDDWALCVPNFIEHNGATGKARALTSQRVAKHRDGRNGDSVTGALPEKRREEKKKNQGDERFQNFWSLYPNKKSKGHALKVWNRLNPSEQLYAEILKGVARAKNSMAWLKDDGQFIPHPATWLNGERWLDDVGPALAAQARGAL
jgi:hypothetical protein